MVGRPIYALFNGVIAAVAQLVEALRYKPARRGFDSRWCQCPVGRTMALGSTQPLTEMSTRNISWGFVLMYNNAYTNVRARWMMMRQLTPSMKRTRICQRSLSRYESEVGRKRMNRSTIAEQEALVKESLFKFVRKHIPSAQLSSIDEIVLSYVVSILEDLGTETSVEEAFDVEGFCEMMAAYFPEFSTIHHAAVCQWMFELEATLSQKKGNGEWRSTAYIVAQNLCSSGDIPNKRTHQLSENSDGSSDSSGEYFSNHEVHLLQEMFPGACSIEVRHCLTIADGDVARAAQLVLHRQEVGQSLSSNATVLQVSGS
ncbi:hypothetical protein Cfor_07614, partial [Coptotermes formosanus]